MKVYVVSKCNPEYCSIQSIWINKDQAKKELKDYTYQLETWKVSGTP